MKLAAPAVYAPFLEGRLPAGLDCTWYEGGADAWRASGGAEIAVVHFWGRPDVARFIDAGDSLRWIAAMPAGLDGFDLEQVRRRGIALTNGAGIGAIPIAEFVLLGMLAAAKNLPAHLQANARREWLTSAPGKIELYQSQALIVGYGAIGRAVGDRLRALGVEVTAVRRSPGDEAGVLGPEDWRPILGRFDWVILSAQPNDAAVPMIGADELAAMKPGAWIVNVARGRLIDQPALVQALHAGRLGGAFLDVVDQEPLAPDAAIWGAPNAVITSHKSAASTTRIRERGAALFLDNLGRYLRAESLRNLVEPGRLVTSP